MNEARYFTGHVSFLSVNRYCQSSEGDRLLCLSRISSVKSVKDLSRQVNQSSTGSQELTDKTSSLIEVVDRKSQGYWRHRVD